jgi:hypothetical protein
MELFIVIELQKNGEQLGNIVTSHTTLQEAQHKFHMVAAAAAISNVEKHSVVLLNDDGFTIERITFEH